MTVGRVFTPEPGLEPLFVADRRVHERERDDLRAMRAHAHYRQVLARAVEANR